jgi:hypothetical protein
MLLCIASGAGASAQSADGFRWLNAKTDAKTWAKIENAFQDELKPDEPRSDGGDAFGYEFLQRIGVVDHSALVIVGQRASKVQKEQEWLNLSFAFNFDLESGTKSKIEHADELWHWKFKRLAHFQLGGVPDVTYTYLTCTECEPSEMFSALRYSAATKKWEVRNWEMDRMIWWTGKEGFAVYTDILEGADSAVSFDCLYGVIDVDGKGVDAIANRCQEVTELQNGKKLTTDVTVLYRLDGNLLKIKPVTSTQEVADVTAKLCLGKLHQAICKLPPVSTYESQQLTLLSMFPTAPKTVRNVDCFRSIEPGAAMYSIADKCGLPDSGGGSAVGFFTYNLNDGSTVTIHFIDDRHIQDVTQSDKTGKTKTLVATK